MTGFNPFFKNIPEPTPALFADEATIIYVRDIAAMPAPAHPSLC
jgi:hypothetical protein